MIDMKEAHEFAKSAYGELLPGHNIYYDPEAQMVVDAETGVYMAPGKFVRKTLKGLEEVPGYCVYRVDVWSPGPDLPDDAGEVELSSHQGYVQAVREMLRQSFDVKLECLMHLPSD